MLLPELPLINEASSSTWAMAGTFLQPESVVRSVIARAGSRKRPTSRRSSTRPVVDDALTMRGKRGLGVYIERGGVPLRQMVNKETVATNAINRFLGSVVTCRSARRPF
jgi:hypothetical protein